MLILNERLAGKQKWFSLPDCAGREPVAQLVEQRPFKAWVLGSSPSGLTIYFDGFSPSGAGIPAHLNFSKAQKI